MRPIQVIAPLTVALIMLKLTGVITWHWLWVLLPAWAPYAAAIAIFAPVAALLAGPAMMAAVSQWVWTGRWPPA